MKFNRIFSAPTLGFICGLAIIFHFYGFAAMCALWCLDVIINEKV